MTHLPALLDSWQLALRAARRSPETIRTYTAGVTAYVRWCEANDEPAELDRRRVQAFLSSLLDSGKSASTALARQAALRRFSTWLFTEGEADTDVLAGMPMVQVDKQVIEPLTEDQLRAMIKACSGTSFHDRRDAALLRLLIETGMRAGEAVGLSVTDVNTRDGMLIIRRGKGGKGRTVAIGPQTALALDRYLRARARHPQAARADLWLGERSSRPFHYSGLYHAMRTRAEAAGIAGFHPHRLRHTAAHRWLAAGGSERGLMTVAGWSRADMVTRYSEARAESRAADEARRLNLGDL